MGAGVSRHAKSARRPFGSAGPPFVALPLVLLRNHNEFADIPLRLLFSRFGSIDKISAIIYPIVQNDSFNI
jgi:hypothetical protein